MATDPVLLPPSPMLSNQRVALFVDIQNLFHAAKNIHQAKVSYEKLLDAAAAGRQITRAIAYVVKRPDIDMSSFLEALRFAQYELRIREVKSISTSESGTPRFQHASWSVGLAIDALAASRHLDTVILASGDGDLFPVIPAIQSNGCRVEILGIVGGTSSQLINAADQFVPIPFSCLFTEQKFAGVTPSRPVSTSRYEGLPKDEDIEAEARALEQRQSKLQD